MIFVATQESLRKQGRAYKKPTLFFSCSLGYNGLGVSMVGIVIIPFRGLSSEERERVVKLLKRNKLARYMFYTMFVAVHVFIVWLLLLIFETIGRLN